MSSTRTVAVLLLCAVAIAGCKKKSATSGGDAEPAGSAAPADSTTAAAPGSAEAGLDESSATATAAEAAAPDEGGTVMTDAAPIPTTGGAGFPGSYNCLGGLTLSQTGNGVTGNAASHGGMMTTTVEINCTARGNECVGTATRFTTKEGKAPKSGGSKKITFKLANGGLDYIEGGVGGFCARR